MKAYNFNMEKWLDEHINEIDIDDLIEYDSVRSKPGYVAISVFAICLGPQYWLISQDFFKRYVKRDFRGKVVGGIIGLMPLCFSVMFARPYQRRKQEYLESLGAKYKHLQ